MTRKDYIALTAALKWTRPNMGPVMARMPHPRDRMSQWRSDAESIADALYADNGAFDRSRFYTACGYERPTHE